MCTTPDMLMVENPIKRYSIGDRTPGLVYGDDGSLTICQQHASPGAELASNWLPSPTAEFAIALRIYIPDGERLAKFVLAPLRKRES